MTDFCIDVFLPRELLGSVLGCLYYPIGVCVIEACTYLFYLGDSPSVCV